MGVQGTTQTHLVGIPGTVVPFPRELDGNILLGHVDDVERIFVEVQTDLQDMSAGVNISLRQVYSRVWSIGVTEPT